MYKYIKVVGGVVVSKQQSKKPVIDNSLTLVDKDFSVGAQYPSGEFIVPKIRFITPDAMRDRFTFDERVLIDSSENPKVKTFNKDLSIRKRLVNLDSPRFTLAMQLLLSEKLIVKGREVELLVDGSQDEQV